MNKTQLIIIGSATLIVVGLILAVVFGRKQAPEQQIKGDLLMWGVFDDSNIIQKFIQQLQVAYPGIKVTYQKKSIDSYEKDLINALAAGRGPDIFYIQNTWIPKHIDKLSPIPKDYLTANEFKGAFVDVAYEDFVSGEDIYALPLYVDTLALFYNKDIFNNVGIANPPSTWEGLLSMVPSLIKKDESGNITRSAIAMGTSKNVNRATDIVSLLMLQSGVEMFDKERNQAIFGQGGQQALEFYTNFSKPTKSVYTWNNQMSQSIDAFVEGKTAMMINYNHQIQNIRAKAPHLKFGISLMPQPRGAQNKVDYANYWGVAVSKSSKYADIAWIMAYYLTEKEQAKSYLELTGRPTARRDLVDEQRQDKELGIFSQQSLSAYSWYQTDSTEVEKIFSDMIESTVAGTPAQTAITSAVNKINLLTKGR